MPTNDQTDSDYRTARDEAYSLLCDLGMTADHLIYLRGMMRSGSIREETAIMLTAAIALLEHTRSHVQLPAAQEKAVHAWTADLVSRECTYS